MPLLTGLVFAATLVSKVDDDLLGDKQYVIVKNQSGEVAAKGNSRLSKDSSAKSVNCTEAQDTPPKTEIPPAVPVKSVEVPLLPGLFVSPGKAVEVPLLSGLFVPRPPAQSVLGRPVAPARIAKDPFSFGVSHRAGSNLKSNKAYQKKVSGSFNDANASEIMKWLGRQGVNFVGASDTLPKGKLSLNLKDVPLHEALETIAEVLGGSWEQRGSTLIFRAHNLAFGAFQGFPGSGAHSLEVPFGSRARGSAPDRVREIPADSFPEVEKAMKDASKAMAEVRATLSEQQQKEIQKSMEEARKAIAERRKNIAGIDLDIIERNLASANQTLSKSLAQVDRTRTEIQRSDRPLRITSVTTTENLKKLLESLSSKQRELHKKQGFLLFKDLTEEQKKLLGVTGEVKGKVVMQFKVDKESLTIKN